MLSNFHILLIGALLCLLMMLVMLSMWRTGIPGVREWTFGNLLGCAAFFLYAFGRELPPLLAYELANAVYAAAGAAILIGYRRFFDRPVYMAWVVASVVAVFAGIAFFHYQHDSFLARTIIIALHQVFIALVVGVTIRYSPDGRSSHYPYRYTKILAGVIVLGHVVRVLVHSTIDAEMTALLQPSPWNLLFLSLGTLVLPSFTFGAVMMLHDNMLAKLEDVANHDFLTGAWTRRAFFELAEREFMRIRRSGRQLALLLIDVDYFKKINDTLGHAEGDQVLIDLVLRAETVLREGIDSFARVGGEEFALLLPETEVTQALAVAERLRLLLNRPDPQLRRPPYSVSIGVAVSRPDEPMRDLMRRADQALYQAKQEGRNRVVLQSA
jgi:diguanylate cyclase (GGDEF)-like protein